MPNEKETSEILTEADHVKAMIDSDGWKSIKGKLDTRILDLQNINNLDMTDVTTLQSQLAARKMAVDIIFDWLKSDVYGFVEQQESNAQKLIDTPESFINRE
jgi:hypothetical protein